MVKIVKIRVYIILYICLTLCFVSCKPKTHLPVVKTNNVTDITQTTATTGGNVTDDGGYDIDYRGVCYGTSQNPTVASRVTHDGTGTGPFISSLTGLTPGTTYYVRAYAMNRLGTGYGNEVSFSSGPMVLPTLTTTDISSVTSSTAVSGGSIISSGGGQITAKGVCWSTSQNPVITADSKTSNGTGTASFTSNLTLLTPNTTYYVRAYASNTIGTGYGNEVSFKTRQCPSATTDIPVEILIYSAILSGTINANDEVTEVTFEYGTSTYYGKTVAATPGTVSGTSFTTVTANISGLNSNTLYHYRVKAVNPWCTIYGSDQTFKTAPTSFQDGDGNIYKTVLINNQVWMQDNLKTTKFNDGSAIPNETGSWLSLTTPSYCWYNDNGTYKSIYGGLYNWHAVNTGKLCPTGWHVPTHDEWTALSTFLGGLADAGGHMKEAGISHWNPPNTGADNFSGFTAVPGGYKSSEFANLMTNGYYWSRSSYDDSNAYSRYLDCNSASLGSQYSSKSYGYSVRCVYGN
jgi:uncharacterized protein (TIGR02145 family)